MLFDLMRKPREHAWLWHVFSIGESLGRPVARAFLSLAVLPYDALICLSAILQSGVRMLFTRRGLLLWYTRSYARRNARSTLPETYREMWAAPVLALGLAAALTVAQPRSCLTAPRFCCSGWQRRASCGGSTRRCAGRRPT
jgi:hypothetical protein